MLATIEFPGIGDISKNISHYKEVFVKDGVLAFRGANLSYEDHVRVHDIFGKALGAYRDTRYEGYVENHSNTYSHDSWKFPPGPNDIILPWHIEHPSYDNPIVLGTWNMYKFNVDSENGKTYFVDNKSLYSLMPDSFKEFSKKCISAEADLTPGVKHDYALISNHWLTGDPVINVSHISQMSNLDSAKNNSFPRLHSFEGRDPSDDEIEYYFEIMKWIHDQLYKNLDVRIVHKWKQGDIVIPDMSRMCHAVTGGFTHKDREFRGIWGFRFSLQEALI
jgi:alpha-ketoglutarate-dependent taurine dioxygenase